MIISTILFTSFLLIVIYILYIYQRLTRLQLIAKNYWNELDAQLKQRTHLILNLVEIMKEYVGHERNMLEKMKEMSAQTLRAEDIQERAQIENKLTNLSRQLFHNAENNLDLKSNKNLTQLQNSLMSLENQIQITRKHYNDTAKEMNVLIQSTPSNIIAAFFEFLPISYFDAGISHEHDIRNIAS